MAKVAPVGVAVKFDRPPTTRIETDEPSDSRKRISGPAVARSRAYT
jgi:hypothetical protein